MSGLDPARPGPSLDASGVLGESGLLAELERWAADARVQEEALRRARERWLRRQAEEEATHLGVLTDLAERGVAVAMTTASGRRQRGHVRALGTDFCAMRSETGQDVLVRLDAIRVIRTLPSVPPVTGDRTINLSLRLGDVLLGLSGERPRVLVTTKGEDTVTGELRGVGADVLTIRGEGTPPATSYVALDAVSEVAIDTGR